MAERSLATVMAASFSSTHLRYQLKSVTTRLGRGQRHLRSKKLATIFLSSERFDELLSISAAGRARLAAMMGV